MDMYLTTNKKASEKARVTKMKRVILDELSFQ